jgi:N-carbamoyl-L-amino-acid hydrolase
VGKVEVSPGAVNAIPSHVAAWLDARGDDEAVVRAVADEVAAAGSSTAIEESFTSATVFDRSLAAEISTWLEDAPLLSTGAGHDAGTLATAGVPTAMLFVRNPTGISHSPHEHAEDADCEAGVEALAEVLIRLS